MTPTVNPPIAQLKKWLGFYDRGEDDDVPPDHFIACQNCTFTGKNVGPREGLSSLYTAGHSIIAFFSFSADVKAVTSTSLVTNILYMTNNGDLYDGSVNPNTLLHSFAGADGFTAVEAFGRVYLSPKALGLALPSDFLYYWDGTNFRAAAGVAPGAGLALAQVNPGVVDAGVHGVAVSFLYATGYLSPPSAIVNITSTGINDIECSGIPTGGAGVVGRVILMTLANQTELFFVPAGTINDNVTTTFTITTHDSALLSSADYLNDVLTTVPSCSSIRFFKGRLILIGRWDFPFILLCSDVGIYDSFNNTIGIINIPRDNKINAPNTALVIVNILYILKPYGTYSIEDNGGDASTWGVTQVDPGLGSYDGSVSSFSSGLSGQDVLDVSFIVHPRGVLLFNGAYSDPPLTWKIDNFWKLTAPNSYYKLRVANDIINKRLYIIFSGSLMLMMDYADGIDYKTVKWSVWTFTSTSKHPTGIAVIFQQDGSIFTVLCNGVGAIFDVNLYYLNATHTYDLTSDKAIGQVIRTALVYGVEGAQTCYNGLRLRVSGVNKLNFTLLGEGNSPTATPKYFDLSTYTNVADLYRGINFTSEKMSVTLTGDTTTVGAFTIIRIDIFGSTRWKVRPSLTQAT